MDQLINVWKSMGIMGYIIPAVFVVYIIGMIIFMKKRLTSSMMLPYLQLPDSALTKITLKVYLHSSFGIQSSNISGRVISGEACPGIVSEGMKQVFYAMPGELEVELTYEYTRPGIMYKNVTKVWGPAKLSLRLEAGKTYSLTFDKETENFVLSEN